MYIGLTGFMGSGKGTVADFLVRRGFRYISLSDLVRHETNNRGLEHSRENLQNIGNELRNIHGAGVLGRRVRDEISRQPLLNWVVDGIRNPAEYHELKKMDGFFLAGIMAKNGVLLQRLMERNREGLSQNSEKEIEEKLARETGQGESGTGQQIPECLKLIDYSVINEGTFPELERKIEHFIGIINGTERPTFDEIFMEIAYTWAQRATCLRRRVGAVIAKDQQQLTAGYNGAPRSLPHCAELGGCLRKKLGIPSGQRHELCRGTHAEQNAITQAAKFGINIEGGTLYCNTYPCVICAKMILNAGIKRVVFDSNYDDPLSKELLATQKVMEVVRYEGKKFK